MASAVTVAIPVLNGGPLLLDVLRAVAAQRLDRDVELLVCDSGSTDGSAEAAVEAGARLLRITKTEFGHGRTRNLLAREARGTHVAFLTQDATPADDRWLAELLSGFELADDVALVSGPYLPRPDAPLHLKREYADFFGAMPLAVHRDAERVGAATFHSDANGALLKSAWERVPFRDIPYAEDQALALDLLQAGYARAFVPTAAVIHSHDYGPVEQLRRHFDEFRALHAVHGHVADANPRRLLGHVRAQVRRDRAYVADPGTRDTLRSLAYHSARAAGAALGSRADALPAPVRARLSLERHG